VSSLFFLPIFFSVLVMLNPYFYILENVLDHTTIASNNIGKIIGILYKINDRAIRGTLLQKANYMADHFDKSILNDAVFEPMCGGFSDSSSALRELTLKATASLVPHLTHPNLEKLSRYLVRLQSDPESSIRTNTVIFFSKLAPYLTEVTRQKILLPAFVRAMKDPFTPCRLAALRSTVKAKTFFDPMGIASRVMPAITPQLLDPSAEVRREAFTAVDDLLFVLRQESERLSTLPEAVLANPNIPVASNGTTTPTAINPSVALPPKNRPISSTNTTSTTTAASTPASGGFSLGGISSWMSSSKTTSTTPVATPSVQQPSQPAAYQQPPTYPVQQQPQLPPAYGVPTQSLNQMNLYSNNDADDHWDDVDDDNDDGGWGDDDDDLDVSNPKSSMQQPSQSNGTIAVRSAPTTIKSTSTASSSLFTAPGTKSNINDDDDFFGEFDNKPAKPVIRPMTGGSNTVGKLVVPVKKSLGGGKISTNTTVKPIIKKLSSNDKDDIPDNWDDF
jgi:SCY1-like protein 1